MTSPSFILKAVGADPDDFQIFNGYWNDDSKPVIAGDWNHLGLTWNEYRKHEYGSEEQKRISARDHRVTELIESKGYEIDWSDQILMCDGCLLAVPSDDATVSEKYCEVSCPNCIGANLDEYIKEHENNPKTAVRSDICSEDDLIERDYVQLERRLENGLHVGQDDKPETFYNKHKGDWESLVFLLDRDNNPFTATFHLFGKNKLT